MSAINTIKFIISHPISKGRVLSSLLKYFRWQLGTRLIKGDVVYEWVNGSKIIVRRGETGLTGNIYVGLDEFSDMGFLLHYLRPNDTFFDIGANVGSYTILASGVVGARTIAFEPVLEAFNRLADNCRLNKVDNRVVCVRKAIGSKVSNVLFTQTNDTTNHVQAFGEQTDYVSSVEMVSLDEFLDHQDSKETPSLIKIDVEGYEASVIEGAINLLQSPVLNAVILEINGHSARYGFSDNEVVKIMMDLNYRPYNYDPVTRSLTTCSEGELRPGNTLFIKNEAFVVGRLRTGQKFKVDDIEM